MPAPKPATEKLEQMLKAHEAKLVKYKKAAANAEAIFERARDRADNEQQIVDSLFHSLDEMKKLDAFREVTS